MALATGEAELRGEDYFGAVLNLAAGVMAAGTEASSVRNPAEADKPTWSCGACRDPNRSPAWLAAGDTTEIPSAEVLSSRRC
jgi:hypothetical protein